MPVDPTVNLVTNPSFDDGMTGWSTPDVDFTATIQASGGVDGGAFYRATCTTAPSTNGSALLSSSAGKIPARPGQQTTISLYMRGVGGGVGRLVQYQMVCDNAAGGIVQQIFAMATLQAGWTRYWFTVTTPPGTATVSVLVFDTDGATPTFALGDAIDVDQVMVHEGTPRAYTSRHPALRWAGGPNYDLAKLSIKTATPGFIIGESLIGVDVLGPDSAYGDIAQTFTSIVLRQPCIVEDGLFVHREVDSCTITTTDPAHLALKGKRIWIQYGSKQAFLGTVVETELEEAVDVDGDHKRGNTPTRTHRVTLRCSAGEEFFATQLAPARVFSTETFTQRLASYMGLASSDLGPDADVDAGVMANLNNDLARRTVTTLADPPRTLMDTFRDLLKRCGRYYRYLPFAGHIDSEAVSRVTSGGNTLAGALRFTDNPELTGMPSATYRYRTHEERTVSYTRRLVSEDPSLFTTGITVVTTAGGVPTTHGPFLTAGTSRRTDVTVELGEINNAPRVPQLVRNWVATLPLKAKSAPFTSRIAAPLQSTHQVQQRIPGAATLNRDGVDELVAIIGMTHTITPKRWLIEYDCAPPHLLTRVGDLDPSPPRQLTGSQAGAGGAVTLNWLSPDSIPTTRPVYCQVRGCSPPANFVGGMEPSDSFFAVLGNDLIPPLTPRTPQSKVIPFASLSAGTWRFFVQYTTDPTPADSAFDPTHLIGQPAILDLVLT